MKHQDFVWDKVVRASHWLVALAVLANLFLTKPASLPHQILGYLAVAAIAIRLLWSVSFASFPARFRDLIPTPRGIKAHWQELKQGREEALGHNHWGRAAIWALWLCVMGLAWTGTLIRLEHDWYYDYHLDDVHEALANILLSLVVLHIAAVCLSSWRLGNRLLHRMKPFQRRTIQ